MISAIVTTYKREVSVLDKAIKSILSQTYSDLELIVVDDSPSDFDGRDAVKRMVENIDDARVSYYQHEKNMGACAARNTGIGKSSGEFIAFLDDDDEWLSKKLEKQLAAFTCKKIGLVYCGYNVTDKTTDKVVIVRGKKTQRDDVMAMLLINNVMGIFPLVRKECYEKCGLFDTTLLSSQDLDMWLRIANEYEVGYVDDILAVWYRHKGEQITTNPGKKIQATLELNKRYEEYWKNKPKIHGVRILKLAMFNSMAGNKRKAIAYWFKAIKISPTNFYYNARYILSMIKHYRRKKTP